MLKTRLNYLIKLNASVVFRDEERTEIYRLLSALLNSSLFAYYMINTSSTAGIMIEQQINDEERFSFPYIFSEDIIKSVIEIEDLLNTNYSNTSSEQTITTNISKKKKQLNKLICDTFELNEQEKVLYQYTIDVTIPIQMKHKGYETNFASISIDNQILTDYTQLYINRFSKNLSKNGKKFTVEIWYTNQVIGMFFKVVDESEFAKEIEIKDKQKDSAIIQFLIKAGKQKITEQLFVQKDIRGFDKDQFYIFKPNEKRLWHKAIGYLDVNEFADAILKAGRIAK